MLAYLILHRNASVDRSHLAFLLWPDSTEAQAHTNLRQLLYHLRQSLPYAEQFLFINKHSLQWLSKAVEATFTFDVQQMEQALAQATQASLWQVRLHWKIATTWKHASAKSHDTLHINAQKAFEEAERILSNVSDPASSDWRDEWIALQFAQTWPGRGSVDEMAAAIEKARPLVEQYGQISVICLHLRIQLG